MSGPACNGLELGGFNLNAFGAYNKLDECGRRGVELALIGFDEQVVFQQSLQHLLNVMLMIFQVPREDECRLGKQTLRN